MHLENCDIPSPTPNHRCLQIQRRFCKFTQCLFLSKKCTMFLACPTKRKNSVAIHFVLYSTLMLIFTPSHSQFYVGRQLTHPCLPILARTFLPFFCIYSRKERPFMNGNLIACKVRYCSLLMCFW